MGSNEYQSKKWSGFNAKVEPDRLLVGDIYFPSGPYGSQRGVEQVDSIGFISNEFKMSWRSEDQTINWVNDQMAHV